MIFKLCEWIRHHFKSLQSAKWDFFEIFKHCESPGNEAISELEKFGSGQGKGMSLFFSC